MTHTVQKPHRLAGLIQNRPMKLRQLISASLLALAAFSVAADKEVEDLLKSMRDTYKGVKAAKIVTKSTIETPMGKGDVTTDLSFMAGNKIYAVIKGIPGVEKDIIVRSDGKKIKSEGTPAGDNEVDWSIDNLQGLPVNLETLNFWDWERQLSTSDGGNMKTSTFKIVKDEEWDGKKWTVLEETAGAAQNSVFVRYFIDPKTNFMWRTVVTEIGNSEPTQDIKVTSLELDPKLDESLFKIG